jgi:hypothetical protein
MVLLGSVPDQIFVRRTCVWMGNGAAEPLYFAHGRREGHVLAAPSTQWVFPGFDFLTNLTCCPAIILVFKPKPGASKKGNGKAAPPVQGKKPKPTRAQLGREIAFDLTLTRCSLLIDIVANALITLAPAPSYHVHAVNAVRHHKGFKFSMPQMSNAQSQALFVLASSMNSLGSGAIPAVHSLALCLMQVRALDAGTTAAEVEEMVLDSESAVGTGSLFGAFAVLQSVGQMILGVCGLLALPFPVLMVLIAYALRIGVQQHCCSIPQSCLLCGCSHIDLRGGDDAPREEPCSAKFEEQASNLDALETKRG